MRQVAHIVLLAQMGSFVPARSVRIGVVDRILSRVGASDNVSRGESTFMVEMRETALDPSSSDGAIAGDPRRNRQGNEHLRWAGDCVGGGGALA